MGSSLSLSVILPVYNEEGVIREVLARAAAYLPGVVGDFEIIAVDDGSTDGSGAILDRSTQATPFLKVIHHPHNRGYGAALRSGFEQASKDFILLMDADGQFDIAQLSKLLPWAKEYDIVAGVREKRSDPFYRVVLGRIFNGIVGVLFGLKMRDVDCGFKLFKAGLLKNIPLASSGILIHTEIFLQAKKKGAKIKEVGVQHLARLYGRQKTVNVRVVAGVFGEILLLTKKSVIVLLIFCLAVAGYEFVHPVRGRQPNVIFITIDALRPDHLGCYGYARPTSPNIDALAREGVLFNKAFSAAPYTIISVPSLLTGLEPGVHKVFDGATPLAASFSTLPQLLAHAGYRTAAFVSPTWAGLLSLSDRFEFFDFTSLGEKGSGEDRHVFYFGRDEINPKINDKVLAWLRHNRSSPFFVYVHYLAVHAPYLPPSPYNRFFWKDNISSRMEGLAVRFTHIGNNSIDRADWQDVVSDRNTRAFLISQYDGYIRYADTLIEALLKELERSGLARNTLVILTADHGEGFSEHGLFFHANSLYDELIHVPLIMRLPGVLPKGYVVPGIVRSIDIMPTILDILNIPCDAKTQGVSLLPFARKGKVLLLDSFAEGIFRQRKEDLKGIRTKDRSYIETYHELTGTYSYELYDVKDDPLETDNISSRRPAETALLKARLTDHDVSCAKLRDEIMGPGARVKRVNASAATTGTLKSLRYLQ